MPLWNKTTGAPAWVPSAVRCPEGWKHADTGELLVAFGDTSFTYSASAASVTKSRLDRGKKKYKTNDVMKILVSFSEPVAVTIGVNGKPYIPININGANSNAVYVDQAKSVNESELLFEYTIKSSDAATAGQVALGNVAIAATKTIGIGPAGIIYTAKTAGTAGNSITVAYVNGGANQSLSVGVSSSAITVNLATDASSVITSTATQVKAAVDAYGAATALVGTALVGTGDGLVSAVTATNLAGGLASVAGTAIILPSLTTIKDLSGTTSTLTFGSYALDVSAVTVNQ